LVDGNIEFFGRMDHQVKVRGFRVELEEIERRLLSHEAIKEAAVTVHGEHGGGDFLCAYVVPRTDGDAGLFAGLKTHLARYLPGYMVPSHFVALERMPLTAAGKIDRKHLPAPGSSRALTGATFAAPATELETTIANHCAKTLKLDRVGAEDNFFDLGGNSLDIIRLAAQLGETLNKEIPVVKLFNYPTVRSLAAYLGQDNGNARQENMNIPGDDQLNKAKDKKKKAANLMRKKKGVKR
jgi:acyl carrier protein